MKKRADQVKVGDIVEGCKVESVTEFGPMLGEAQVQGMAELAPEEATHE